MGTNHYSNCSIYLDTARMSDISQIRSFSGNNGPTQGCKPARYAFAGKHRLVEECECVWISALQHSFGKKHLINLIRQANPLDLPIPGGSEKVWLTWERHRLPGPTKRMSSLEDGTARLWLVCPCCRRKAAKLYYKLFDVSRGNRSEVLCRSCHGLVYQSENCSGNQWFRNFARPMKRLLMRKANLMALAPKPQRTGELQAIEAEINRIRDRCRPPRGCPKRKRSPSIDRRPYRDVTLIEKYFC
jgi:hypothetical protein